MKFKLKSDMVVTCPALNRRTGTLFLAVIIFITVLSWIPFYEVEKVITTHSRRISFKSGVASHRIGIVVPFIKKSVDSIRRMLSTWDGHHGSPCTTSESFNISLVMYYSRDIDHPDHSEVKSAVEKEIRKSKAIERCFGGNVLFISAKLTDSEDAYTSPSDARGPNNMFFGMFTNPAFSDRFDYAFIMEPDVLPLRSQWLQCLENVVMTNSHHYWQKGTVSQHTDSALDSTGSWHMNGNAIYNLQDAEFKRLIMDMRSKMAEENRNTAYDYYMHLYRVQLVDGMYARQIFHKFVYSDFILNLGGYIPRLVAMQWPETCFVHSKSPIDLAYWMSK